MSTVSAAKPKKAALQKGIAEISIRGYKSLFNESRVEVRPLTILAGANSSGKSSIIQPLLLLKQTLEAPYDPGPLLLSGPNVRFTSLEQLFSRSRKSRTDEFSVRFAVQPGLESSRASFSNTYTKGSKQGIDIAETVFADGPVCTLRRDMTPDEIDAQFKGASSSRVAQKDFQWNLSRTRCFLDVEVRSGELSMPFFRLICLPAELALRKLIHVPGLRGNPERTYKTTAVGAEFPGTFENYVASVVRHWQATRDDRLTTLGSWLETLGLTWKVEARQVDDTQVELRVGRLSRAARGGAADMVSIADVGFGVSQMLPVLVALLAAEPGQLVYLEQPEIHLHPRAQTALAQLLAEAATHGVRVVAETHSALLLLGVRSLVAEGRLSPDLVKLHWFRRREDGVTEVQSADLDESGAFGERWPEDFADVALEAESRYLDAAEARRRHR